MAATSPAHACSASAHHRSDIGQSDVPETQDDCPQVRVITLVAGRPCVQLLISLPISAAEPASDPPDHDDAMGL